MCSIVQIVITANIIMSKLETPAYHHGNLRESLIEAALKRLSEQTVETLSLRDLARLVGVSIAAVYRHFPNKDALLAEVAVDGFKRLIEQWERHLPSVKKVGAEERFRRLGESYVAFALASPAHYRLMFVHGDLRRFPDLQAAAESCFAYVLCTAADVVREAGAEDRWTLPMANAAWALVHGYVMLALGGRLTKTGRKPDLSPAMLSRFLQLPKDVLAKKRVAAVK